MDEPVVWYEGSGTTDRRFLSSDERGSIVSVTDSAGAVLALNKYDEFGQPQAGNLGIWGYTGQAWLPTVGLWHYKARAYDPELGRFLQTDPIGYWDSPNLYAYVLNDPVNLVDPLGLDWRWVCVVTHGFGTTCGFAGYQNPTIGWTATLDRGLRNPSDRASNEGGVGNQEEEKGKRRCNAIQRAMEKAGDAAADWAALSFDAAMGSWVGGVGAEVGARRTGSSVLGGAADLLLGPVKTQLFKFSGMSAAVSLSAYFASGQPIESIAKKGIEAAVNRALKRFSGPGGEKLKDEVTSELQSEFDKNRCRPQ